MPNFSTFATILLIAARFSPVIAVPNVTVIPLGSNNCASWPGYLSGTGTTGPFQFQVDQPDDVGVDGLYTSFPIRITGSADFLVADLRKSRTIAKPYYRCVNGTVRLGYNLSTQINISKDNRNAFLFLEEGYVAEPYVHEIDGVRQPGVYLGAKDQTTWGFIYVRPSDCGALDYYETKLLGLPQDPNTELTAAAEPDFSGFLKIVPF